MPQQRGRAGWEAQSPEPGRLPLTEQSDRELLVRKLSEKGLQAKGARTRGRRVPTIRIGNANWAVWLHHDVGWSDRTCSQG